MIVQLALMMKLLDKGLTLLELMIASGILLIAICGLLFTFITCMLLTESNRQLIIATNDAQYVLEQVKEQAYNNISNFIGNPANFSNLKNLNNETVTFPNTNIGPKSAGVTVNVSWTYKGYSKNFQLSTRIAR